MNNKPCPFCGSNASPTWIQTFTMEKMTRCSNTNCQLFTQEMPTDIWNNRPYEESLKGALSECVIFGKRIERWLYKGNDEPMWYEDFMYYVHDVERRFI